MKVAKLLVLLGVLQVAAATSLIYYTDSCCAGEVIEAGYIPDFETGTCYKADPATALARSVRNPLDRWPHNFGHGYGRQILRFYDNSDCFHTCREKHVVGWDMDSNGCIVFPKAAEDNSSSFLSYSFEETWRINHLHEVLSDGFCVLSHGDVIVARGRKWKMQQVAGAFFRDIPAEEWDDETYVQNTTHRLGEHGDVDVHAKTKLWQYSIGRLEPIALENWNETYHVQTWMRRETISSFQDTIDRLCERLSNIRAGPERAELLQKMPDLEFVCRGKTMAEWRAHYRASYKDSYGFEPQWMLPDGIEADEL